MAAPNVPMIRGAADLRAFLDLIKDREKYDALLKEYEDRIVQLNALMQDKQRNEELHAALTEAINDRQAAVTALTEARAEATHLVEEAEAEAKAVREEASSQIGEMRKKLDVRSRQISDRDKACKLHEQSLSRLQAELDQAGRALAERENRLQAAEVEHEARVKKLKEAVGG